MNCIKKKDYAFCMIIMFMVIIIIRCVLKDNYVYGSTVDWSTQHFTIPEYFRTRFYETGQLIPSFIFNLGSGQNIYNFSYYGLLSPIILFSYLMPFISMRLYIEISSVLLILISIFLFYIWMKQRYSSELCFSVTFLFAMSGPLLFHTHRHIMYINYMPFLILALIGVDKYFHEKKKLLLIFSTFLIIMSNYFFSVVAILAIAIYGIFVYLEINEKFKLVNFIKTACLFASHILISVLMSCVLLIPTLYTLFSGRAETNSELTFKELFIPNFNADFVLYSTYSMGLTAVFIAAIVYLFFRRRRQELFLGVLFLTVTIFPVIIYISNAKMYINAKTLIPCLPLGAFVIAIYFNGVIKKECNLKWLIIFEIIISILTIYLLKYNDRLNQNVALFKDYKQDIIVVVLSLIIFYFLQRKEILIAPTLIISIVVCYNANCRETFLPKSNLQVTTTSKIDKAVDYIDSLDTNSMFRTYVNISNGKNINKVFDINDFSTTMYSSICNSYYTDFYYNELGLENKTRNVAMMFTGENIIYNMFSGTRYIISNDCNLAGYTKINELSKKVSIYENKDVYPIGYATSNIMSSKQYETLEYPYNAEALLRYIVVDSDIDNRKYTSDIIEYTGKYTTKYKDNAITFKEVNDGKIRVNVKNNTTKTFKNANEICSTINVKLAEDLDNKLVICKCHVDNSIANNVYKNSNGDIFIQINNICNKLSNPNGRYFNNNYDFRFVLSDKAYPDGLNIDFSYGKYDLSDFGIYTYDYSKLADLRKNIDEFYIDKYNGDSIEGSINVSNDGYFRLSIPYDDGFDITIDGKSVSYEKVDTAFIGFPIDKGEHEITINYTSPGLTLGKILSFAGIFLFVVCVYFEKKEALIKLKKRFVKTA